MNVKLVYSPIDGTPLTSVSLEAESHINALDVDNLVNYVLDEQEDVMISDPRSASSTVLLLVD